jgi:hypothetical protein
MSVDDGVLDPAHSDDGGLENAGVAGIPKPDANDKPELKVSEDGNVAEYGDKKYVRQEALHQERQERQKLAATLAELDPLMPEFNEFLKQRTGRRDAQVDRARQSLGGGTSDYTEDELQGFAINRGYFAEDGQTPDLRRAQTELDIISGISRRQAHNAVRPVHEDSIRTRANTNRNRVRGNNFVDGQPVAGEKYVNAAINALSDEQLADDNVANLVQVIAAGLESLDNRKNGRVSRTRGGREPMFVEGSSGRFDGDTGELSGLELAAARARGKTPEQWAKMSKAVNTSKRDSAILEDV